MTREIAASLFGLSVVMGCAAIGISMAETPGERFRETMEKVAAACANRKLERNEVCGAVTKLKPADPLATAEGRFAHSIKIPNPVPEDSGYKSSMTPQEYFDHLCKTEAGEFIYKTVENVEGIYLMRPGEEVTYGGNHLYALEDPYRGTTGSSEPEIWFVRPSRYLFLETLPESRNEPEWKRKKLHPSILLAPEGSAKYARYFGYNGKDHKTMQKVYDSVLKSWYGYTWRGITRPYDRESGIAGSELIILDLQTKEVLAVHRGYAQFYMDEKYVSIMGWGKGCPRPSQTVSYPRQEFIFKVLKPVISSSAEIGESHPAK